MLTLSASHTIYLELLHSIATRTTFVIQSHCPRLLDFGIRRQANGFGDILHCTSFDFQLPFGVATSLLYKEQVPRFHGIHSQPFSTIAKKYNTFLPVPNMTAAWLRKPDDRDTKGWNGGRSCDRRTRSRSAEYRVVFGERSGGHKFSEPSQCAEYRHHSTFNRKDESNATSS